MDVLSLLVLVLSACATSARTFHDGEYVTSARRSQFRQQRTEWHDLLGRYCPRFGRHQVVTIPIQRPTKWMPEDDYKLMLSFDSGFVCVLLTITAKLRYGTGKVDVALYELVSAIEAAQSRPDTGPVASATSSGISSPTPPPPPSLSSQPGRPPRPQVGPPKRGSHAD